MVPPNTSSATDIGGGGGTEEGGTNIRIARRYNDHNSAETAALFDRLGSVAAAADEIRNERRYDGEAAEALLDRLGSAVAAEAPALLSSSCSVGEATESSDIRNGRRYDDHNSAETAALFDRLGSVAASVASLPDPCLVGETIEPAGEQQQPHDRSPSTAAATAAGGCVGPGRMGR